MESSILMYFAVGDVGRVEIVDEDVISFLNISRQVSYNDYDIEKEKIFVVKRLLTENSPWVITILINTFPSTVSAVIVSISM